MSDALENWALRFYLRQLKRRKRAGLTTRPFTEPTLWSYARLAAERWQRLSRASRRDR